MPDALDEPSGSMGIPAAGAAVAAATTRAAIVVRMILLVPIVTPLTRDRPLRSTDTMLHPSVAPDHASPAVDPMAAWQGSPCRRASRLAAGQGRPCRGGAGTGRFAYGFRAPEPR